MPRTHTLLIAATLASLSAGCHPGHSSMGSAGTVSRQTGAPAGSQAGSQAGPWRSLVEGNSLAAWRGYKRDTVPPGWSADAGVLAKSRPVADIITRDQFGDFELSLEWQISEGGNAGIFYRGTEEYPRVYWTGPEYQLLDDEKAADGKSRLTSAGAAYGLYPSPAGHLKPIGDWNETRIVARGAHVEHWLNGVKLVEYELSSADWTEKVKASKFNAWPNYGLAKRGHIALQGDHAGSLAFRNVRIRDLR
ncbi:MAG: DUF1080 domain-containing protein [Gemmatimonadetes bacterium]|nr:DUF1080 domain-containing protein [Gemmatimonadota bacterium]